MMSKKAKAYVGIGIMSLIGTLGCAYTTEIPRGRTGIEVAPAQEAKEKPVDTPQSKEKPAVNPEAEPKPEPDTE